MSHYKSNVRDQVFNLFEVLGVDKVLGEGSYADLDVETAVDMLGEIARLAEGPVAASFEEGDRNPPVFDPQDPHRDAARGVQEVGARRRRRRMGQAFGQRGARRHADAQRADLGPAGAHPRRQPRGVHVRDGRRIRRHLLPPRHRGAEEVGQARRRPRLGLDHGADRAGRRLRCRRGPHEGRSAGRRHLAHRRRQALHHVGRFGRPVREHHASGAGPPRGRRAGHQGPVAVLRAEVPLRSGDR